MKAKIIHQGGLHFIGQTESGHALILDSVPQGETSQGPTPMEVVLQAAAVCSAMDVAAILTKRHKQISRFELEVEGERSLEHPKIFKTLSVTYIVAGPDITLDEIQKAVALSQDKYCSVINMLKPTVQVNYSVRVE